jgi:membrane protease YdiL (CAAX protease family)
MAVEHEQDADVPSAGRAFPVPSGSLRTGHAILITLAFYVSQVVLGVAVAIGAVAYYAVTRPRLTPEVLAQVQRVIVLPVSLLGAIVGGLVAVGLTRSALRRSSQTGDLGPVGWCLAARQHVLMAAILGVSASGVYLILLHVFPPDPTKTWGPLATAADAGGWQRLMWALLAVVVAPPVEEFVFRGVLWTGLLRSMTAGVAGAAVTLLFVLSHAFEARDYWPAWLAISLLGVGTVLMRARAGSLIPPMALHACYNAGLVAAVYLGAA